MTPVWAKLGIKTQQFVHLIESELLCGDERMHILKLPAESSTNEGVAAFFKCCEKVSKINSNLQEPFNSVMSDRIALNIEGTKSAFELVWYVHKPGRYFAIDMFHREVYVFDK